MWVLIVLQLMGGGATSHNSLPITYTNVTMQEFSSQESCESAKNAITVMNAKRNDGANMMNIRDGMIQLKCVKQ
jgi:hypothetical protein